MSTGADAFSQVLEQHIRQHHEQKMEKLRQEHRTKQYLAEQWVQGNVPNDTGLQAIADLTGTPIDHNEKLTKDNAQMQGDFHIIQQGLQGKVEPEIWKPALERFTKHPAMKDHADAIQAAVAKMRAPQVPPPQVPTAAGPGQTPGTATAAPGALGSLIAGGTGPAAQASTSPVQPEAPVMPGAVGFHQPVTQQLPPPPELPPVGAPEQSAAAAPQPIEPVRAQPQKPVNPLSPRPIMDVFNEVYPEYAQGGIVNPAQRAARAPLLQSAASINEKLRLEDIETQRKQDALSKFIKTPEWANLPASSKSQWTMWAAVPGSQMPSQYGMASMATPEVKDEDAATLEAQYPGILQKFKVDPTKTNTVRVHRSKTAMMMGDYTPVVVSGITPGMSTFNTAEGGVKVAPKIPGMVEGAVPASQLAPIKDIGASGNVEVTNQANLRAGKPTLDTGLKSVGQLPKTTVIQTPGELPTVSTRTTGVPGASKAARSPAGPAASSAGGGATAQPLSLPAGDSTTIAAYKHWVDGGPAPTGKGLKAVQTYAEQNHLPLPTPLSAQGVKDVADIDNVLSQIREIKQKMEQRGMDKDDTRNFYSEYVKYKNKQEYTPNNDIYTALAFEKLRSVAAALKNSGGSRALPIFEEAMQHTPQPDPHISFTRPISSRLPATPHHMYGKLGEMEGILTRGRQEVLSNERKSGVIKNMEPVGGSTVKMRAPSGQVSDVPSSQVEHYKSKGAVVVQ